MRTPASPDDKQLKLLELTSRINMGWVLLYVLLALWVASFVAFIAAVFYFKSDWITRTFLGGFDVLLIWPLHRVVGYLFPKGRR